MLLTIDLGSEVPLYQQIRDRVVEAIAGGDLAEGSALPSIRQLAADLAINFHTVNKAYDLLRQEGIIRINRKSGAMVRRDPSSGPPQPGYADDWQARLRTLLAEATVQGMTADEVLQRCGDTLASFHTEPTTKEPA
ncbi:DNA-binding transcriptional regulator YhcF (GntR family) [Thermocatellispora tengchongensis]|uniref:DNA-binding transcriptional regulator YhcF (GntR family) n=1 Tax=Thermocatellispora tengchongensis TaxID=1073253 RepID=A0A840PIP0_9ACTN|nr:GntR family transcriptional regulator [Thermocatellispora tengchongensis]MBB5137410.1 DNA-binding transcriptional regulator YhcF (GntR family) [Thermocatellispora tengchongensis]